MTPRRCPCGAPDGAQHLIAVTDNPAHALLSPVGGIDLALELLRKKTAVGEDETFALIGSAQRQVRLVGTSLQEMMRGVAPGALVVLD